MSTRIAVISPFALHRDALAVALESAVDHVFEVVRAEDATELSVEDFDAVLADTMDPQVEAILRAGRRLCRPVIVWGGLGTQWEGLVVRGRLSGDSAAERLSVISSRGEVVAAVLNALRVRPASGASRYVAHPEAPRGHTVVDRTIVPMPTHPRPAGNEVRLTPAEHRVALAYLVTDVALSRAEVAARLGISERTLKAHLANMRRKVDSAQGSTRLGLRRELRARGLL